MENRYLITAHGDDRVGLIASLTGALYDMGANLAECGFHHLGSRFDFRALAGFPDGVAAQDIQDTLGTLPEMDGTKIVVVPGGADGDAADDLPITHTVLVTGEDRPGLVARISEVLTDYQANIVRMHSEFHDEAEGRSYVTRFRIAVDPERADALDNALSNMAGSLRLNLVFEPYEGL